MKATQYDVSIRCTSFHSLCAQLYVLTIKYLLRNKAFFLTLNSETDLKYQNLFQTFVISPHFRILRK